MPRAAPGSPALRRHTRCHRVLLPVAVATLIAAATTGADDGTGSASGESALARIDSLWFSGGTEQAHALIDLRLPEAHAANDSLMIFELLFRQGRMWSAMGHGAGAAPALGDALAIGEVLGHRQVPERSLLETLRWLGVAYFTLAEFESARETFVELEMRARRTGDADLEAWSLVGLAHYDDVHGDQLRAAERYRRAVDLFAAEGQERGEIYALNGLGVAYHALGAYDEARRCYVRTATLGRELGRAHTTALAENNLGVLEYELGDPGRAVEHYREAARLQLADGAHREHIQPLINLALAEAALGNLEQAEDQLKRLRAECDANGYIDLRVTAERELAGVYTAAGRRNRAERTLERVLDRTPAHDVPSRCLTVVELAGLRRDLGHGTEALTALEQHRDLCRQTDQPALAARYDLELGLTLLDLDRTRQALSALTMADSTAADLGRNRMRLQTLTALSVAHQSLDAESAALACLEEAEAVWESDRQLPLDPEWRESLGTWTRRFSSELAWLRWRRADEPRAGFAQVFATVQTFKARTLLERSLGPGRHLQQHVSETGLPRLDNLQREVLRPGEVFLDFLVGHNRSLLVAIDSERVRVVVLPAERELRGRIDLLRDLILTSAPDAEGIEAVTAGADALRTLLLGAAVDVIDGATHLFVSPDGVLYLLPWPLLLDQTTAERSWELLPSAAILTRQRSLLPGENRDEAPEILAVTGRDTSAAARTLAGARWEVDLLHERYRNVTRSLPQQEAPPESLAAAWSAFDILHFAAHSSANDQAPWNSTLYLTAAPENGGWVGISARAIATARIPARLVFLASCQSVAGRVPAGEGLQGLTGAFLSAGVPAVVATLWPVDDGAAARFVDHFYTRLASGASGSDALAFARGQLAGRPETAHPRYWAAFVLVGTGEAAPTPAARTDLRGPAAGSGIVILGGLAIWSWLRRRATEGSEPS